MSRDFNGARVLITGGLGFIGSNTARRLVELGARVTLLDNLLRGHGGNRFNVDGIEDSVEFQLSDIRDTDALSQHIRESDFLFNLAAQTSHLGSMNDPETDLQINAVAQASILEACRVHNPGLRVLFTSTRQVYGRPDYLPVDETHPVRPVDVNGIGKQAGENLHLLYQRLYGVPTGILRLSNVYGPRMRVRDGRQTFLGLWIRMLLTGESIDVFGDGGQERDLLYVDDCVEAMLLAATADQAVGRTYNVGQRQGISLAELASILTSLEPGSRWNLVPFPPEREAIDIGNYSTDTTLIEKDLGWSSRVSLRDGLSKTIEFYRRNGHHYWEIDS